MPVDQLEEEIAKVMKFYKIYENVNRKLIDALKENSLLNKELNHTLSGISQEKKKVDELLFSLMRRLKDSKSEFQDIKKEFYTVISIELQNYINNSQNNRDSLIK